MSRWEPNAASRLAVAAVELFAERGYDNVTVIEIAERAGLTKRTFFRHFADKREILFHGQDSYRDGLDTVVANAPAAATPMETIGAVLAALAAGFTDDRRDLLAKRQKVIASTPELKERDLLKNAALIAAMTEALVKRGVDPSIASLAAHVGALAFSNALQHWLESGNRKSMATLAEEALSQAGAAIKALN
ncbi:TetR/AcrR family transcriptional regulator [Mycobacterium talmoniae]|uniref:Mycofactocin biosynthesis transcriptional regulator MftR n=1 Tax=Mycobacterium talmoniae TaxID=1858794 RepID=A0A1S1NQP0_9MYCO|nr:MULTISPECIES: TetR/AcrR family transcriptional regulator [Mycobacterium]OHV06691.1 TetR family transcriptional regulator [Mycobacterium talmoniae]PQM48320.1 Putative mycofactocin biosynthesis transcriptional regulator MftR [Mycobacterium talmoniae]TDH55531.1 TetR family transcriptional regulator [Mycobacterium eburneum]